VNRNLAIAATTSLMIAVFIVVLAVIGASHAITPRHLAGDSPWDGLNVPAGTSQQA
jgi:hypothetical protein